MIVVIQTDAFKPFSRRLMRLSTGRTTNTYWIQAIHRGPYEELLYFLPLAFSCLLKDQESALNLVSNVVSFASEFEDELQADGLLEPTRLALQHCLRDWSSEFRVVHFDAAACAEKGWTLKYQDYVAHSEVIGQALDDLARSARHRDLAVGFVESLSRHGGDPTKAAWFLEFARGHTAQGAYSLPNCEALLSFVRDDGLLLAAAHVVHADGGFEKAPTYWRDAWPLLGLFEVFGGS